MEGPGLGRELRKDPQDLTGLVCLPGASPQANESRGRGLCLFAWGSGAPTPLSPGDLRGR